MQVLLITQEFPPNILGGVGYHAYQLASSLVEQGHEVHVLTGESDTHVRDESTTPLPAVEVSMISYRRSVAPRVWFARKAAQWLQSFDGLDEFDFIHAHEYIDFDAIPFDGPTLQKLHFNLSEKPVYLSQPAVPRPLDDLAFTVADATIWRAERRLERRAIRSADIVVANSELTKGLALERHDLETVHMSVIYNGVDVERFTPNEDEATTELLFVGGDQQRKGIDELIEAVRVLAPSTDVHVTVAGTAKALDTEELEANLPINFVGRVDHDELVTLYRRAGGLVHPALYEPFGNVILEALSCATPVVTSDPSRCGAAELLDEQVGVMVDPSDPIALAEAMHAVVEKPGCFDAARCRAIAEQYTWHRVAGETIDLVRSTT